MHAADLPDNEPQRLAALHGLHVLDTADDEGFSRLTQLACELFDVPTSLVSLVDRDRQWFKARQGLDACETSREVSFCAHAVAAGAPLVVEDTHEDERFCDNPLVTGGPHIRFYAGHPLRPTQGMAVGTLCLISPEPRTFSDRDRRLLEQLAGQVDELLRQHQMRYHLSQTNLRYQTLFNGSATGIVRIDRTGKVLSINPYALSMLGYAHHEVLGRNVSMLTPASIRDQHDGFLAHFLAGGDPRVIGRGREVDALHQQGHTVPVHLAINAIADEKGDVVEFLGILTNLTDVHAATKRMHKEQSLLKVLHQGITDYQALMSGEQLWTFLMEALRELTDSDYALIGEVLPTDTTSALKIHAITDLSWNDESRHLMEMLRSGDMTLTNPNSLLGRVYAHGETVITDDVYGHSKRGGFPPGHPRLDNYLGAPIFSGDRLIGMFAIANSRQPLDQSLLNWLQPFTDTCALLINLYRQMAEREQVAQDLATARDQAEKANRAKSDFLSSMSHELRTPLNAIIGFAQLLAQGRRDPLSDKQQRQVGQIEKSGQHLLSLINEVLDLAKIESGHMSLSLEAISLQQLIEDATSTLEANVDAAGLHFQRPNIAPDWVVQADYTRTKQVLLNLLSNAIKYNRPHGSITLEVVPQAPMFCIRVTDTGKGVPPERLGELFEPFNRLDEEHGAVEGTGIGLAITRELVERMGGAISVDSQPERGSTFWFTLPMAEKIDAEPSSATSATPGAAASQSSYRLLYIEDNPTNQKLMEDIVDDYPHVQLQTVSSAELGLQIMRYSPPDLVLIDINLPGMSGYQALEIMRSDDQLKHLPVIALSANAMERDIARGLEAGFSDYLTKPIDLDKLSATLSHYLAVAPAHSPRMAP